MYWGLEHGPMKIWHKFGKDRLKTKGSRAHTRKTKLAPWWPQMSQMGDERVQGSEAWSNEDLVQIWKRLVEN